jgi:hypothetical protein
MATSAFGKAFRAAREAGNTEFEFGGKKYNTKMKGEGSAPAIKVPSKSEAAALEAKGLANQKAHQDEEEKAEANAGKEKVKAKVNAETTPKETSKSNLGEQGRASKENERMIKEAASGVGTAIMDYANKPFLSPAMRKSEENKGKTFRDLSGKVQTGTGMKRGGAVKKMASGGMASSRGDGIAQRGKTRGKMC